MPLAAATIQATLEQKMTSVGFDLSKGNGSKLAQAIAETIHHELTTNAVVTTAGSAAAQTGTIS